MKRLRGAVLRCANDGSPKRTADDSATRGLLLCYRSFASAGEMVDCIQSLWARFVKRMERHPEILPRFRCRLFGFLFYWVRHWPFDFEDDALLRNLVEWSDLNIGADQAKVLKQTYSHVRAVGEAGLLSFADKFVGARGTDLPTHRGQSRSASGAGGDGYA